MGRGEYIHCRMLMIDWPLVVPSAKPYGHRKCSNLSGYIEFSQFSSQLSTMKQNSTPSKDGSFMVKISNKCTLECKIKSQSKVYLHVRHSVHFLSSSFARLSSEKGPI